MARKPDLGSDILTVDAFRLGKLPFPINCSLVFT